jgi:hypothetical protein
MLIQDLETILGKDIEFTDEEDIFNLNIRRAVALIKNYLNKDSLTSEFIAINYPDAIIEIISFAVKNKGKENIKSITQGSRVVTYSDGTIFAITETVKQLLPTPYLKMC